MNVGPPTSFVAWAESETEEIDASCKEQQTTDPVENSCGESYEKVTLSPENAPEENHKQGTEIGLYKVINTSNYDSVGLSMVSKTLLCKWFEPRSHIVSQ